MRLIISPHQDGITNMATDQSIMEAVGEGRQPPTLRLYGWSPPCLSLGYTQRLRDVDLERLTARGWGIVRRPTGGKAILHADELTYSISLPQNHALVVGDIVTSYRRLSQALKVALERVGLRSQQAPYTPKSQGAASSVCFEEPSAYEITVNGKKLIGSAQVRRHKAVLQHGTLPLYGDITRICEVLVYPNETARQAARQQLRHRAITLAEALDDAVDWQTMAQALQAAFAETFDLTITPDQLSPAESLRLEDLRQTVFGDEDWLQKR